MKEDLFNDIIIKFLNGDATGHEKRMLSNWLKEDPRREEVFYYHLSRRESENPQHLPDVDAKASAYEKYLHGEDSRPVTNPDHEEIPVARPAYANQRWWFAASILLVISTCAYFYSDVFFFKTYAAEDGDIRHVTLEDGSRVTLNANSFIKVPRDFMRYEDREVWISGEAFFEVTRKTDRKKFIVHTNNFDVEVLGTKFNVNDRRCKSEVILAEGKVKLVAKDQEPLIMKPGEQVSLSNSQAHFQKQMVQPEKYEAWQNNLLVFDNTPLTEVSQIIQDYYGVEIIVSDSLLGTREFSGTLPNDDLDVILLALRTAYKIEIKKNGEMILLNNKTNN